MPSAVSLNNHNIFDDIFGKEYVMTIVGTLECESPFLQLHILRLILEQLRMVRFIFEFNRYVLDVDDDTSRKILVVLKFVSVS